jgi:hypothetical protein
MGVMTLSASDDRMLALQGKTALSVIEPIPFARPAN